MSSLKTDRNCVPCRIVSGAGLIGISGYLAYHARRNPSPGGRFTIFSIALAFGGMGLARWGQIYPFDGSSETS